MTEETNNPTPETTNVAPEAAAPEAAAPSFLDSLPEDIRGEASLANFQDAAGLAKSYVNAQKLIGASVRIPTEDSSAEAVAEFYKKLESIDGVVRLPGAEDAEGKAALYNRLGRPESHSDYKLEIEGLQTDPAQFDAFAQLAHQAGLTNEQMNVVMGFEAQRAQQQEQALAASQQNAEAILKEKWGHDYNARLEGAKAAAQTYAETYPEAMAELINGPAGNNPALLAMLSELQGTMVESGNANAGASAPYGMSAEEARFKIEEIQGNRSHAYFNPADPKHADAMKRMKELYELAYPSQR